MVVEVMGRYAGWIALYAGVAGGADVILMPEIPFELRSIGDAIAARERLGARFSIVVVAEGAAPVGGEVSVVEEGSTGKPERLGGVGAWVAAELEALTGKEARTVVLGHLQRGGAPTSFDRVLATRFGGKAFELVQRREFGVLVANRPPNLVPGAARRGCREDQTGSARSRSGADRARPQDLVRRLAEQYVDGAGCPAPCAP